MVPHISECPEHGPAETLSTLQHKEIKVLAPNTTSEIKQCDPGTTNAMKTSYRLFKMKRAIAIAETNRRKIYSVNFLSAMMAIQTYGKM